MLVILLAIAFVLFMVILIILAFGGRGGQNYNTSNGQNMGETVPYSHGKEMVWNGKEWKGQ